MFSPSTANNWKSNTVTLAKAGKPFNVPTLFTSVETESFSGYIWQQVMLEWQRDWSRKDSYDGILGIVKENSGAFGMGVEYANTMVHKLPQTEVVYPGR